MIDGLKQNTPDTGQIQGLLLVRVPLDILQEELQPIEGLVLKSRGAWNVEMISK